MILKYQKKTIFYFRRYQLSTQLGHLIGKYLDFSFLFIKTSINKFLLIKTGC